MTRPVARHATRPTARPGAVRPRGALFAAGLATLLGAVLLAAPAHAIAGGKRSVDPDGVRRHTVRVEIYPGSLCTGTVVGPDIVLTAAHCVISGRPARIVAYDRRFRPTTIDVVERAVHPSFDLRALQAGGPVPDIAVLRLARALPRDVEPVRIGAPDRGGVTTLTAAGFGAASSANLRTGGVLRETSVRTADRIRTQGGQLLAIGREGQTGTCVGDSGGPLLRRDAEGFEVVGVLSWVTGREVARGGACGAIAGATPIVDHAAWLRNAVSRFGGEQTPAGLPPRAKSAIPTSGGFNPAR